MLKGRTVLAAVGAVSLAGGLSFAAVPANAAPIYSDTGIVASHPSVDAITGITAAATWTGSLTPTDLGSSDHIVPVPSIMNVQFTATGGGTDTWTIVSENNIPAGVFIGLNPASGLLTVTPPGGPVIAANNQNITLTVKVTDGAATAFETLTAQPLIVSGGVINAIHVTASTDAVTLLGANNNTTGVVNFASTPAGAAFTAANLPPGVSLNGNQLTATTAIPDTYHGLSVTATDAAGATAVDTFSVEVDGAVNGNDTPRLSQGHAVMLNAVRENVYFVQSGSPSCDHFTIVGPGQINGHEGWVPAHLGVNVAVYGGLEAHHGYTVYYQPVSGPADCSTHSVTLWPGAHWGYVYFIS